MTGNLTIWNAVETTDPARTKSFTRGGGFKGTATNATWLAKRATEIFGPCGIGWGVKILDERLLAGAPLPKHPGSSAQIHRVHICLWYLHDGKRGEIEHFGQTEFTGERRDGSLFTDEEAPKKSLTDAMSKALSLLGFAADIHMGLFDDNKYVSQAREKFAETPQAEAIGAVSAYVAMTLKSFETFNDAEKLKAFWLSKKQADMRTALEIVNGTPEYAQLFTAMVTRAKVIMDTREAAA